MNGLKVVQLSNNNEGVIEKDQSKTDPVAF